MEEQKFVELYCDEKDGLWKITIWTIPSKDFDPFKCSYKNLCYYNSNVHKAVKAQKRCADYLRSEGYVVHTNNANPNSYFQIIPKWIVELIIGKAFDKEAKDE